MRGKIVRQQQICDEREGLSLGDSQGQCLVISWQSTESGRSGASAHRVE